MTTTTTTTTLRALLLLMLGALAAVLALLPVPVAARSAHGQRVLVVLDKTDDEPRYSKYLESLRSRGLELTIADPDGKAQLVAYEETVFDHLLVLAASSASLGGAITAASIIDFQSRGGNVLIAGSSSISELLRDVAIEYSVEFDEKGYAVRDPFHTVGDDVTLVASTFFAGNDIAVPPSIKKGNAVLFRGVGHRLTGKNVLITPLLTGSPSSFSALQKTEKYIDASAIVGTDVALVSALQARNNARIVFTGSVDMFSNELVDATYNGKPSGNRLFIDEVTKWVFQEKGVLEVRSAKHHRQTEDKQHGAYRIKDDMVFDIEIAEFHGDTWRPFVATDVQFEAVMLDPYIRTNFTVLPFKAKDQSSHLETRFRLPDVYGVFTFKVDHRRHGYSWVVYKETVAVHPFRHNEYPRFLTPALPYYVNAFSMIGGFFVLSLVVVYNMDPQLLKKLDGKPLTEEKKTA